LLTCSLKKETDIMVAVTYGVTRVGAAKTRAKGAQQATPQKNFFIRLMDALVESRLQQAHREILRHAHLLPYTLDERGDRLVKIDGKEFPFGGW
jgi:hypothetical protein